MTSDPSHTNTNGTNSTSSSHPVTTSNHLSAPPGTCLHCHNPSKQIQVSCDACNGMICVSCHWCHEFQANHEIRVCDRCDSFLCRDCEEMDQCHDCGEVVCKSCCGALLVCKFCGSSLCEECATACAKCGIVLCGRDAKFAVDCDTCRLSYCLVCLASGGQKETCIRCHHRPSKRMEQLVHLRLKSIYKAFQQSARTSDAHPHLKRAALAAMHSKTKAGEPKVDPIVAKAQADAAAAELLAELEQEEEKAAAVSNKKKRKKHKKKNGQTSIAEAHHQDESSHKAEDEEESEQKDPGKLDAIDAAYIKKTPPPYSSKDPPVKAASANERKPPPVVADHDSEASRQEEPTEQAVASNTKEENEEMGQEEEPDPMQTKLCELVNQQDAKGIETLLEEWKGVPGKAVLRKNAKKALKRLNQNPNAEAPLVRVTKSTPKTSTTKEVVLEMDSTVVGYIIGKGGQTIRNLMDESGAKVWIDQDSMKAHEPRVAYVSGAKKTVDVAVKMISELVTESRKEQEKATQQAEANVPGQTPTENWIQAEIECEARFVPLVIGRRGWNIKHIQDASGAKVDIDQTVTPRLVILKGTPTSVETAKRLINDVLAYPQAQLKSDEAVDDEGEDLYDRGSPPPSSYVMTGDQRSIVSASSSLSSTPEPSMASSKGREYVMPPPGLFDNSNRGSDVPLHQRYAPPAFGAGPDGNYGGGPAKVVGGYGNLLPPQHGGDMRPSLSSQHALPPGLVGNMQQHRGAPPHMLNPPVPPQPGMQHQHLQPPSQQQHFARHVPLSQQPINQSGGALHGMNQLHQQRHGMQRQQQHNMPMHQSMGIGQQQQQTSQQQPPPQQQPQLQGGFFSHVNPNEAGGTNQHGGSLFGSPSGNRDVHGTGLFNQSEGQSLLAPTFQRQQSSSQAEGNDSGSMLHPLPASAFQAASLTSPDNSAKDLLPGGVTMSAGFPNQDESNLVDSLFGPSSTTDSNILASLNGLSVGNSDSGKPWGDASAAASIPGWGDSKESSRLPVMQQHQQNESRFHWGS